MRTDIRTDDESRHQTSRSSGDESVDDYDFNFMFKVKTLRSDRVELRPFIVIIDNFSL